MTRIVYVDNNFQPVGDRKFLARTVVCSWQEKHVANMVGGNSFNMVGDRKILTRTFL